MYFRDVDLAVARTGAAVAAWSPGQQDWGRERPVRVARRRATGVWTPPVTLNLGYDPSVAIAASGVTVVVQESYEEISARIFTPGAGWGRRHWLARWPSWDPAVTIGPGGRVLVVWSHARLGGDGNPVLFGQERNRKGRWTSTFRISPPGNVWDVAGEPVIDSRGYATVAFLREVDREWPRTGMVLSKPRSGAWTVEATYPEVRWGRPWQPQLLRNRADDLALAFSDRVSLRHPGSTWETTPGGGVIGIYRGGTAIRMWWDGVTLSAQKVPAS